MPIPFPEPTVPNDSRAEVLLGYLDYFRDQLITKVSALPADDQRTSRLASGWTPAELVNHLRYVELRWLEWGFDGLDVADPWGDQRDRRWFADPATPLSTLVDDLRAQGERTRAVVTAHELTDLGQPSDRWDGDDPPPLERVLLHLMQEYARHVGHIDIVAELVTGE